MFFFVVLFCYIEDRVMYMNFFDRHKFLTIFVIGLCVFSYFYFFKVENKNKLVDDKSQYYTNDLYMSDQRIYNNYLDEREKKMYNLFLTSLEEGKREVPIKLLDYSCTDYNDCTTLITKVGEAILVDHPEIMSYSGFGWKFDGKLVLKFDSAVPVSFFEKIGEQRIKVILSDIIEETKNMSDKEKIRYVYNWMGNNTKYDKMFTYSSKNQSIYSVFMSKQAVCAGFAKASQIIFQNIGIKSHCITGNTSDLHMWNIVEYNGKYYFFDSTVATSLKKTSDHYYDGLKQEEMSDYIISYPEWYPEIEKTSIFP